MKIDSNVKSIRKALAQALEISAKTAELETTASINQLPEYFVSTKVASLVYERFPNTYKYSFEDQLINICQELKVTDEQLSQLSPDYRIEKGNRADLVLRSKSGNIKHIVEFKRGTKASSIRNDALRLASLCWLSPVGHRVETNYLVAFTTSKEETVSNRTEQLREWLDEEGFQNIEVSYEPVDLSFHTSTRPSSFGKELSGAIWQFKYKE